MKRILLKNRYTLLLTVLATYILVLVIEGTITGREPRFIDFENPYFDLNVNNFEEFVERQDRSRNDRSDR